MSQPLRVLVIDDSDDDTRLLVHALEQSGFQVQYRRVDQKVDTREALDTEPWDIVYVDWVLPGFSGLEALTLVLAHDPDRPVIVLSGVYDENLAIEAMGAGAHDYINKRHPQRLVAATVRELQHCVTRRLSLAARAEAERALALHAMKDSFISTLSHELRTPLTSIMGYAEFLEDGFLGRLTPGQAEVLTQIQRNGRRLEKLVDDLLDFACLEAGTFRLYRRDMDLAKLIAECLECLYPQASAAGLRLEAQVPEEPVIVLGDPQRLGQVLLNLVSNAIKFTPAGGRIEVALSQGDGDVTVTVRDTGIGIASDQLPLIFQRFFQADSSLTRVRGGAGIGLTIAQALTIAHGGGLEVDSVLGDGSTFTVRLPMHAHAASDLMN